MLISIWLHAYVSICRSLLNEEVDLIQSRVRDTLVARLRVTLR
jgi:hypothetical protein